MATKTPAKKDDATAVAAVEQPDIASMYETTTSADLVIPQVRLVAELSSVAKGRQAVAKAGDLILANGADDPSPLILAEPGESVDVWILGRRKFAATTAGGSFQFQDQRDPDDPDSWEGWIYDLALPEHDEVMPATMMLWKTAGMGAFRQINAMLDRQMAAVGTSNGLSGQAAYVLPIKLSTKERTSKGGHSYYAWVAAPGERTPGGEAIAIQIQSNLLKIKSHARTENVAPERFDQPGIA